MKTVAFVNKTIIDFASDVDVIFLRDKFKLITSFNKFLKVK